MRLLTSLFLSLTISAMLNAQNDSNEYFYQIETYPNEYSSNLLVARMIDGLGFRYYWGSEGLRSEDLRYRPSEGARSMEETIDHIAILSQIIVNTSQGVAFQMIDLTGMDYAAKRSLTLKNLEEVSNLLKSGGAKSFGELNIIFSESNTFPYWNLINGPIADAINHVGQIVTFRRSSGNPVNPKAIVLTGTVSGN